jgi:ferritin-like protein
MGQGEFTVKAIVSTESGIYEIGGDDMNEEEASVKEAMRKMIASQCSYLEPELSDFFNPGLPKPLQEVSIKFHDLAMYMKENLPPGPQRTQGLWDLLRAKDCAVRAARVLLPMSPGEKNVRPD